LDAAKRVNQLCEEMGIPHKNPGISAIPNQQRQTKEKTSQYNGVSWSTKIGKWHAKVYLQGAKNKFGGYFDNELDAAKRLNQICEQMGIPYKNYGIGAIPNEQWQPKQKTSQYIGVYWYKQRHKWCVELHWPGSKKNFGGYFNDELDAARKVNQLCEKFGIPHKNHGIETMTSQQYGNKQINDLENTNPVISSKIANVEDDNDSANENKRKREKDFIINDNMSVEKYYFYDEYLK